MDGIGSLNNEADNLALLLQHPELDMEKVQNGLNHVLSAGVRSLYGVFEMKENKPVHGTEDRVKTMNALVGFGRYLETCKLNTPPDEGILKYSDDLTIGDEQDDKH